MDRDLSGDVEQHRKEWVILFAVSGGVIGLALCLVALSKCSNNVRGLLAAACCVARSWPRLRSCSPLWFACSTRGLPVFRPAGNLHRHEPLPAPLLRRLPRPAEPATASAGPFRKLQLLKLSHLGAFCFVVSARAGCQ